MLKWPNFNSLMINVLVANTIVDKGIKKYLKINKFYNINKVKYFPPWPFPAILLWVYTVRGRVRYRDNDHKHFASIEKQNADVKAI